MKNKIFNFSSGPAMLPTAVLKLAKKELCNWNGLGVSVMEISHRSKEFIQIAITAENDLRTILNIPNEYKVLFCHGGARAQFSSIPMNLLENCSNVDYVVSGYWSYSAAKEAKKYCNPNVINVINKINGKISIKPMCEWPLSVNSAYIHYCPNETIDGLSIDELPNFINHVIIGDFSSTLLSRPLDIKKFGVIYAGSQKNIGPAGLTLVIIREDLLKRKVRKELPTILNYKILSETNSMFNTPSTFAWYMSGLVFKWIKSEGGLIEMKKRNKIKSDLIYSVIDKYDFYYNNIDINNRSWMNIPFHLINKKFENLFLKESLNYGLYSLKGHNSVGGLRASLYNAMPLEGGKALVNFMNKFVSRYG